MESICAVIWSTPITWIPIKVTTILQRVVTYPYNPWPKRFVTPVIHDIKPMVFPRLADASTQRRFEQDMKLVTELAKSNIRHKEYGFDHAYSRIEERYMFISGIVFEELQDEHDTGNCERVAEILNGQFDTLSDIVGVGATQAAG